MNDPPRGEERVLSVDDAGRTWRLDAFLAEKIPELSRSYLQKLIEDEQVLVNGARVRPAQRLKGGETVTVHIPPPRPAEPLPQQMPLEVLFEDRHLLVLVKPPGLVVHPAPGNPDGTLVNALLHRCRDLSGIGGVQRPGIVHRLDRDTSGVMLVSKTDAAHRRLSEMFGAHQVEKTYLALAVRGSQIKPLADEGRFDTGFGRHPVQRRRFTSRMEGGKRAITDWRVERRYLVREREILRVSLMPRTGRTHQLRVHLSDAGHPIMGDKLYGGRTVRALPPVFIPPRQALHACRIAFRHPISGEELDFSAPLPQDLLELIEKIEKA